MGDPTAIVAIPLGGGPERILTTAPQPAAAAGSVAAASLDSRLRRSSRRCHGGDLWLQPLPGGAPHACRTGRTAPSRLRSSADGTFVVAVVDQAEVWQWPLDGERPPQRLDDGSADFCSIRAIDGRHDVGLAGVECSRTWRGTLACPAHHVRRRGSRRRGARGTEPAQARNMPDGSISVRDDTGWPNLWLDGRHSSRAVRARRTVVVDGAAALVRAVARRRCRRLHAQRARSSAGSASSTWQRRCDRDRAWRARPALVERRPLVALRSGRARRRRSSPTTRSRSNASAGRGPAPAGRRPSSSSRNWSRPGTTARRCTPAAMSPAGRTLCWIHGGPTDQWQVEFMPRIAYWWSRGWDVLVPDRGCDRPRSRSAGVARRVGAARRRRQPAMLRVARPWWSAPAHDRHDGQLVGRAHRARRAWPAHGLAAGVSCSTR